jgi:predicted transcriptional regulator
MIYNHIVAHPGVSFNILKKVFDINDSTLRYHLNYLKKADKIAFGDSNRKRKYFPNRAETIIFTVKEDTLQSDSLTLLQDQILTAIKENPGINQKDLVRQVGVNRFKVKNNLNKLLDLCIIRRVPNKRNVCYEFISRDRLQFEMLMSLVTKFIKHEIDEETFLELKQRLE